ncbi:hypothetical protein BU14_0135s0022 [Porphyra umbilicalis]|uniref:Uncharacterized protein n=1 Tax=Porphyra umbilicalis TaxID=2786 RepID=A0A1X6PA63_PORUM|nr:hypothetical protein BU14_0135s0022 [Porphyra umbilicalis]|eukprot:OSX77748.1 hypothetical protein BU14_0135s0022 [Porphyra umbilicalis]
MLAAIRTVGDAVHEAAAAATVVAGLEARLACVAAAVAGRPPPACSARRASSRWSPRASGCPTCAPARAASTRPAGWPATRRGGWRGGTSPPPPPTWPSLRRVGAPPPPRRSTCASRSPTCRPCGRRPLSPHARRARMSLTRRRCRARGPASSTRWR